MTGKLDNALGFYENALRFRSQRQQLLASNIANADTPNYKARDLDFGKVMQAALTNSRPIASVASTLTQTNPGHLAAGSSLSGMDTYVALRTPMQNSMDGNTVDMDVERNAFTENALRYEMAVTMVQGDIKGLLSVLQG
ncbi:flagellar basal body rod protein FlgB [Methylobacter sp. S3L5C]|uniref:flagellar basal body rod protein FlgB n=1 Tax=Methylobacter sp. S3L5C TaxID=2839024 RepID=UPI001FAD1B5D|nr:flagellar basal body rod protein FlgB [Methylobacter sp. S3L5C]UOA08763.1 flagellar basal body rod protein FlgB [Methylobacter sp. S3L5C]